MPRLSLFALSVVACGCAQPLPEPPDLGETIEAQVVGGAIAIFGHDEDEAGWLLTLREGSYVFSEIRAARRARTLSLSATLDDEIDALVPGMRGRLVFDLRTDLVTLGGL